MLDSGSLDTYHPSFARESKPNLQDQPEQGISVGILSRLKGRFSKQQVSKGSHGQKFNDKTIDNIQNVQSHSRDALQIPTLSLSLIDDKSSKNYEELIQSNASNTQVISSSSKQKKKIYQRRWQVHGNMIEHNELEPNERYDQDEDEDDEDDGLFGYSLGPRSGSRNASRSRCGQEPPMSSYEDLLDDRQGMNSSDLSTFKRTNSVNSRSQLRLAAPGRSSLDSSSIASDCGPSSYVDGVNRSNMIKSLDSKKRLSNSRNKLSSNILIRAVSGHIGQGESSTVRRSRAKSPIHRSRQQRSNGLLGLVSRLKLTKKHESIEKLQLAMLNSGLISLKKLDHNLQSFLPRDRMTTKELEEHVKLIRKYPVLALIEYKFARRYETYVSRHGQHEANQAKNQNKKCLPYDYNRVVLRTIPGELHSDYINASFVDSYLKPNAYIATQGPNDVTIEHFWRMVWEQKSFVVVMLTKVFDFIKVMCNQYWPIEVNKSERYGSFEVTLLYEEPLADFVIRTIKVTRLGERRSDASSALPTEDIHNETNRKQQADNYDNNKLRSIIKKMRSGKGNKSCNFAGQDMHIGQQNSSGDHNSSRIYNRNTYTGDRHNVEAMQGRERSQDYQDSDNEDGGGGGDDDDDYDDDHGESEIESEDNEDSDLSKEYQDADGSNKITQGEHIVEQANFDSPASAHVRRPRFANTRRAGVEVDHLRATLGLKIASQTLSFDQTARESPELTPSKSLSERERKLIKNSMKRRRKLHANASSLSPRPTRTKFQVPKESELMSEESDIDNNEEQSDHQRSRERIVYQFHYHNWPSHTCPFIGSLLHFRRRVRICTDQMAKSGKTGPTIVHCNDGCGRTGAYLCIDANLELAEEDGVCDVFNYAKKLRQSRKFLIENLDQYKFVYDTLDEALFCGNTWFNVSELHQKLKHKSHRKANTKKNEYQLEYEKICRMTGRFSIGDCAGGHRVENREKNRDVSTVPPDNFRPYLTSFQTNDSTDYINAVFVDGYTRSKEYIVTEWPLHRTISDFWSLVYDHDCNSVILLANPLESSTYPSFLPTERELRRKFGPVFSSEMVSYTHYQNIKSWIYTINKKIVSLTEVIAGVKSETKTTQVFQITCWPQGHRVPTSTNALVELMNMVERWRQRTAYGPVCVVSLDGKSRAGVYCAANVAIEQVVQHGEVDVFQAVKTVRRHRPQLIENMTEYKYCYDLILHYVLHYLNQNSSSP